MQSQIETLVAATVTTTTFTISGTQKIDEIEVTILSSADTVTVAYGLGGTVPANPTDKADDLDHVPPVVGVPYVIPLGQDSAGNVTVKTISAGTPEIDVKILP